MSPKVNLGLVGAGVWGRNYIKTIEQIEGVVLKKIVCKNPQKKSPLFPKYEVTNDWLELTKSNIIDGVIIASPPSTHFDIALEFIKNKKSVIIEKPLTIKAKDAEFLTNLAIKNKVNVKVNHVYLYHPMYRFLKEIIDDKTKINSIYSYSGNYGPFREDISPLWDWGPHDIAMCLDFFGDIPRVIEAKITKGISGHENKKFNVCVHLTFENNRFAELNFGNIMTRKERLFKLNFTNFSYIFDPVKYKHIKKENICNSKKLSKKIIPKNMNLEQTPLEILIKEFVEDIKNSRFEIKELRLAKDVIILLEKIEREIKQNFL
tara:strand:- start:1763 stop:2719 length:957 start_codon:yes stop_codon:yes gene_type:complete